MEASVLVELLQANGSLDSNVAALDQLSILVLQMDSADSLKKLYPPSIFVPILANYFYDSKAEAITLEIAARIITYYLQFLPLDTIASLTDQKLFFCAIARWISRCNLEIKIESDLAQQLIKIAYECSRKDSCEIMVGSIHHLFNFILTNWMKFHNDTLISGLNILCRLSNYIDVWFKKYLKQSTDFSSPEEELTDQMVQDLQKWISKLIDLSLHHDALVKFGALKSLSNVVNFCLKYSAYLECLNDILKNDLLLEHLLFLMMPAQQSCSRSSELAPNSNNHLYSRFDGPSISLIIELILNMCCQRPSLLKHLACKTSIFGNLCEVLLSPPPDELKQKNMADDTFNSELVSLILNLLDGLTFIILYEQRESFAMKHSTSNRPAADHEGLKEVSKKFQTFLSSRVSTSVKEALPATKCTFISFFVPQDGQDYSPFRSKMDNLGLSSDADIVSDVFHLWIKSAIINKTNIVNILMAMNTVQIRTCWNDLEGRSLLASAVHCGYPSAMMALINRGSDPNSGLKETPLHVAASRGDIESLRFLVFLRNSNFGVATNPLLRNTLGFTPRECCKQCDLAELLRINEEEFKAQFEILRGGTAGQLMKRILPLLIRGYNTSMNPLLRLQALRLITRVCRSCPGYAMINLTLKEEEQDKARGQITQFHLRTQLLNLITTGLNQGCLLEACQMLSLILALVDQPGVREGLQRHGVPDFLSWRLEAESLLKGNSHNAGEHAEKWTNYLPNDLTDAEVTHHDNTENPNDLGNKGEQPQCIYEISWDQTYQFGDWLVLRSGNSSVIILQEYTALCIEVKLCQALGYPMAPTIVATIFTRSAKTRGEETGATHGIDNSGMGNAGKLEAKTIFLCSSVEGGQIREDEDATSQWLQCQVCIMRACSCKVGVIPLPLKCTQEKASSSDTSHGLCNTLPFDRENKPLIQKTGVSSCKLDPEDEVCVTKRTSSSFCGELESEKKPTVEPYVNSPSRPASASIQGYPNTLNLEHTQSHSCTRESDFVSQENRDVKTNVDQLNRLTAGLLSLSISSSGLLVCLRETVGADRYLKALAAENNAVVTCNHTECTGAFDPDFDQHFTKSWNKDQDKQITAKQTLPNNVGLEKIIIAQSRSGGMKFFGTDGSLVYRANAFSRTARLQKIHPLLEPLTLNQRKVLRTFYRSCYLRKLRECFIQRGTEVLETLKPISRAKYSKCMLNLMNMAKTFQNLTRSECVTDKIDLSRGPSFHESISDATPYEFVTSGVIPVLLSSIKHYLSERQRDPCLSDDSSGCNNVLTSQQRFFENFFGNGFEGFIRKLIETLELFERFPLALPNFGGSYEQLVQRSIYLEPKLRDNLGSHSPSMVGRQLHPRKVDLSNYRIYTAPLITFHQLKNWLQDKIDNSPWHMDALENMGFMHDASQPDGEIHLVPPPESVANPELDVTTAKISSRLKIYSGGLFHWLSTNGGREPKNRVNPTRFFKRLKISTSDTKINNRQFYLSNIIYKEDSNLIDGDLTQTQSPAWIRINPRGLQSHSFPMLNQPWVIIDTGVLLETSHYLIKVPMLSDQWPRLQHWKLLASSDRMSWDLLSEHHVYPRGQTPSSYWGPQGERIWAVNFSRTPYRFYWLISVFYPPFGSTENQADLDSESTAKFSFKQVGDALNYIELQNIEFYGYLKGVCLTQKCDSIEGTGNDHVQIKPGTLVVLREFQLPERYLKEIWPPSFENDVENPPWLSKASSLPLGLVLSRVESGHVIVAWFEPVPNKNHDECSSRVIVERSAVEDDSGQPDLFIFPSHVTNYTSIMEVAPPDADNPALQIFVKTISFCEKMSNSMEEDCKLRYGANRPNSITSTNQLLSEKVSNKKSGILEVMQSPQSSTSPIIFGQLVLPHCRDAFRLGDFQFSISFYASRSSPWPLHDGGSMHSGPGPTSQDADCRLTMSHMYDNLTRGVDSFNPSKIATLDANLPGFVPPFDSRSGSQSQPAMVTFKFCEGDDELRRKTDLRRQGLHLWLSWNETDLSEDGTSLMNMKSTEKTPVANLHGQQLFPNIEISFFQCWVEEIGVVEEFPGCGKLKRPISPTLSNCRRTYTLNYSSDTKPSEIFDKRLHREDNESLIHSSVNKLPFISSRSNGALGCRITGGDLVEECLSLLRILYDSLSSSNADQQPPDSFLGGGIITSMSQPLSCPVDIFFSSRLRGKVQAFMENPWSVIQAAGNPHLTVDSGAIDKNSIDPVAWCQMLMRKFHFLVPFSTRVDFWRVTSFGLSRSIVWLQQQQQKQAGGQLSALGDVSSSSMFRGACSRSADAELDSDNITKFRFSASDFGYLWGPSMLLNHTHKSNMDLAYANNWIDDGGLQALDIKELHNRLPNLQPPPLEFGTNIVTSSLSSQPLHAQANGLNMLGRLQREVACVPRPLGMGENDHSTFWPSTVQLLTSHAMRKQELEVGFENEEGTGLGPTMEFYTLISAEFMRKSHYMWVADYARTEKVFEKTVERGESEMDWRLNDSERMLYIRPRNGLFPAAWPANALPRGVEERFRVLGIAIAKCLQDQRRMDLHFSTSFLKLLIGPEDIQKCDLASRLQDFTEIYPEQGRFFLLCLKYLKCAKINAPTSREREQLEVRYFSSKLSDLCLTMEFPSITTEFGQSSFRLEDSYDWDKPERNIQPHQNPEEAETIDHENLGIYIERSIDFAMDKGIRKQVKALRDGFNLVFPLSTLAIFTTDELNQLISGDTSPNKWTHEELLAALEPATGYTRQSTGYQMLLEVLSGLTELERKCFVKFVTGSPNLPPGGFRNLHPIIKVAKKDAAIFGPYPSVNTCMHYLKLPEYDTAEQLKEKLLTAAAQPGFFLN